jgi:uncharacterized SAM-binding protein YcdF (DUF218 family)
VEFARAKAVRDNICYNYYTMLNFILNLLVKIDQPKKVDAMIVLGGDLSGRRTNKAIEMYKRGFLSDGPLITTGGPFDSNKPDDTWADWIAKNLIEAEIPKNQVVPQNKSTTTDEDIEFSKELLKKYQSTMLITSYWHTQRSLFYIRKYLPKLDVISCPSYDIPKKWWKDAESRKTIIREYMKWIYILLFDFKEVLRQLFF